MSIAPHRLLGFAFASADLLLELNSDRKISFAIGSAAVVAGPGELALIGRRFDDFIDAADRDLVFALLDGAASAARQGPVTARLAGRPLAFSISVCKLPQNGGAISCALTRSGAPATGAGVGGLHDRAGFEAMTKSLFESARASGESLELSFIDLAGLAETARRMPADRRAALEGRIAGALRAQSKGGAAAAQLDAERYALIRDAGEADTTLVERLERLITVTSEAGAVSFAAKSLALDTAISSSQIVKTLRYALDGFIENGVEGAMPATLQAAMNASLRSTIEKAGALGAAVAERRFNLAYQPVVTLKTGELHHYEVLVRFGADESPFPMIRMAEELDLIEALDLAVAQRVAGELVSDESLKLAVNVSGRTVTSPAFIEAMTRLVTARRGLGGRMMFEVTESAAIDDLALADRHIQALRELGCEVCLDDFGAGAASLAYLQQLRLDLVKIDGRYIRQLQHGGREATFIRHLVRMCAELGVRTVAEMIETAQCEEAVRLAGVDFGQGYFYGAPSPLPAKPAARAPGPVAARRRGAVESWG